MAESCVAEPLPHFEDAEQLIADEYFKIRQASDSAHEDDSTSSGSEDSGDISLARPAKESFMDPRAVDLEEMRGVKEFSSATCKCTKRKGTPMYY